ncbi:MAG: hypothetical protein ABIK09_18370 [Pseudomonadota bacterium]
MKQERWGIKVIDSQLKGLEANQKYMIYGGISFDLLSFLITFLASGLKVKQRTALFTSEDPSEIIRVGRHIGLDLERDLHKDTFMILKCKPFLGEKLLQLGSSDRMIQELRHLMGAPLPHRVGFYPLSSFISDSNPDHLMRSTELFLGALKRIRSTVMVAETVKSKAEDLYLIQELRRSVDGVFRLTSSSDDTREISLEKDFTAENRKNSWVYFIQKGVGIQAVEADQGGQASEDFDPSNPAHSRRILLVSDDPTEVDLLREGLEPIFTLEIARSETEAMTQLLQPKFGMIVVAFSDDERGQAFCRYVRTQRIKHPLVLVGNQKRRAWERASVLLQGVDDFISRPYSQVELISRISSILRRASFGFPFEEVAEYIGAQKRLWQKLKKYTKEDPDTGLATLKFFNAALEHELFKAKMVGYPCALMAATVNVGGDLKDEFTSFIKDMVRDTDLVTLLPSGEYMLFLGANGPTEVDLFLKRLAKGASDRFTSDPVLVKYAIANYPKDATDGDTLVKVAANRVQEAPSSLQ